MDFRFLQHMIHWCPLPARKLLLLGISIHLVSQGKHRSIADQQLHMFQNLDCLLPKSLWKWSQNQPFWSNLKNLPKCLWKWTQNHPYMTIQKNPQKVSEKTLIWVKCVKIPLMFNYRGPSQVFGLRRAIKKFK